MVFFDLDHLPTLEPWLQDVGWVINRVFLVGINRISCPFHNDHGNIMGIYIYTCVYIYIYIMGFPINIPINVPFIFPWYFHDVAILPCHYRTAPQNQLVSYRNVIMISLNLTEKTLWTPMNIPFDSHENFMNFLIKPIKVH